MRARALAVALAALASAQVRAQAAPPATTAVATDPARLAAARALVEAAMPADMRDQLLRGMVEPTMANVRTAMLNAPQMQPLFASKPQARDVLDRFIERTLQSTLAEVQASMPALMEAMAGAYARRFTVDQLREVQAFYMTPTGRALVAGQPAIATDPAVQQVQRAMMTSALARLPEQMKSLQAELAQLGKPGS